MKKRRYRVVTGVLLFGWMLVIFLFSSQEALQSGELSGGVAYQIIKTCDKLLDTELSVPELSLWAGRLDYPVRKLAHMTEYALLAAFAGLFFLGYKEWGRRTVCDSLILSACYAMTDEAHQLFVAGRAGRFSDVCIDTCGAAIGLLIFTIILKFVRNHCEKKRLLLK